MHPQTYLAATADIVKFGDAADSDCYLIFILEKKELILTLIVIDTEELKNGQSLRVVII
jgi:hypothetical protein